MMQENSIENVLHAQELIELLARLAKRLNNGNANTTLDCRVIYCHKTGRPIGNRDLAGLSEAIKLHGTDYVERTVLLSAGGNCHPLWIRTDSETLDKLMKHDPRGYAVYCLKLLTAKFYRAPHVPKRDTLYAQLEQIWSLARAYQILGNLDQMSLATLNDNLCGVLTFYNPLVPSGNDVFTWIGKFAKRHVKSPEDFAILAKSGLLADILENATQEAINSIGRHNAAVMRNPDKFLEIPKTPSELASKAPSQIRGQRRAKQNVFDAEMSRLYGEMALNDPNMPAPGQEAWRKRLAFDDSKLSTDEYADMSFDLGTDTRKPDDKVTVRRMSPMLLRTLHTPKPNLVPRKPMTPEEFAAEQFANRPTVTIQQRLASAKTLRSVTIQTDPLRYDANAKSQPLSNSLLSKLRNLKKD